MKTKPKQPIIQTGTGYAWLCDFGLCHWVAPTKNALTSRSEPSPEASPVKVRIIREGDYRKLIKAAKQTAPERKG